MATSFLQYCAMCEKQINTPSNAILYCSQACRRKDAAKPLSASVLPPIELERPASSSNSRSSSPKPATDALATPTIRIPADDHAHRADLDPTEWKPKLRRPGLGRAAHMRHSEAYRYLASFHCGSEDSAVRSGHQYSSSMYNIPTLLPSLSNTPTTSAGSLDRSWEYDFNTRPLQNRCNPVYSLGAGVDVDELVTPFVPPKAEPVYKLGSEDTGSIVAEDFWGKKVVMRAGPGLESAGLGKLLGQPRG